MNPVTVLKTLGPIDLKSVRRDSMLVWMTGLPIFIALVVRFLVPVIASLLLERYNFSLEPYYKLITGYFVIQLNPVMFGVLIGFLLLDERDDRTLDALKVTPLSMTGYLFYRISIPMALSVILTFVAIRITGLGAPPLLPLSLNVLMVSIEAPIFALFMASFAENKVAGFALMKGAGILFIVPVASYFLDMPWQLLAGLLPTYWPAKVFWLSHTGEPYMVYWLIGLIFHVVILLLFLKRFNKVMFQR